MCVICYVPAGVKLPPYRIIKAMRQANPHGMGFCTPSRYDRGVNNFESFYKKLKRRNINEPCIMHFRLATHGSIKTSNCHPFRDAKLGLYFAHNGVLPIEAVNDKTDSETAFRKRFLPIIRKYGLDSKELDDSVKDILGCSKFIFMQCSERTIREGKGGTIEKNINVKMYGNFEEYDGCYYSNLRFIPYL